MEMAVDSGEAEYVPLSGSPSRLSQPFSETNRGTSREIQKSKEAQVGDGRSGRGLSDDPEMAKVDSFYGPSSVALPRRAVVVYGMGHMLNDLTAACWFTYLLVFLTDVGLSPKQAGAVMLSGQLADGFATIVVGQLIDRFGHFKLWHAGGSVLVGLSFSSVFGVCIACELLGTKSFSAITVGYSTFAAIFNLGWAATQISHMSLVNCITANSSSRVSLNSCRNAYSMVANLCLYAIAYMMFWAFPATSPEGIHLQFRWIAWVSIFIGGCFVVVFLLGVSEPRLSHHAQGSKDTLTKITVISWFKRPLYYQVAVVYMLTRLTTNVSQAFLPFYVINDLKMETSSKAVVPALIYISSFLASIVLQELHWTGHRLKGVFTGGACLWIVSGAVIYLLPISFRSSIYAVAGVIGLGNASMLVTATSMQGVLVGHDLSGCAFVYGSLSFLDKLTCGFVLYFIEGLNDETQACPQNGATLVSCNDSLIRLAVGLVPGGCALLAAMITLSMNLGDTQSEMSSLNDSLLNKVESLNDSKQDEANVFPRKGSRSRAQNVRSTPRPILPSRTGSIRRNKSAADEFNDDIEDNTKQEGSPLTFWKRLEAAMVGRWGSIRKPAVPWLE